MRKMQLMLLFWIIATCANAANLTPQENEERARKCGQNRTLPIFNEVTHLGVYISSRHFISDPLKHPKTKTKDCRPIIQFPPVARTAKYMFIGNCTSLRGFVLLERFDTTYENYACLSTRQLQKGDKLTITGVNVNTISADVVDCKVNDGKYCLSENPDGIKDFKRVVFDDLSSNQPITFQGFGTQNSRTEAEVDPVFEFANELCIHTGICPVSISAAVTTQEPTTTTSEPTTTTKQTTAEPTTTELTTTEMTTTEMTTTELTATEPTTTMPITTASTTTESTTTELKTTEATTAVSTTAESTTSNIIVLPPGLGGSPTSPVPVFPANTTVGTTKSQRTTALPPSTTINLPKTTTENGAVKSVSAAQSGMVTEAPVDAKAEKELKEILNKCEDEYLCWDGDIFASSSSCSVLVYLIFMIVVLFY